MRNFIVSESAEIFQTTLKTRSELKELLYLLQRLNHKESVFIVLHKRFELKELLTAIKNSIIISSVEKFLCHTFRLFFVNAEITSFFLHCKHSHIFCNYYLPQKKSRSDAEQSADRVSRSTGK